MNGKDKCVVLWLVNPPTSKGMAKWIHDNYGRMVNDVLATDYQGCYYKVYYDPAKYYNNLHAILPRGVVTKVGNMQCVWKINHLNGRINTELYRVVINIGTEIMGVNECENCGLQPSAAIKLRKCRKCEKSKYCSRKCQKIHWRKLHRLFCGCL